MDASEAGRHVRYAADEKPPAPLAFGLGLQLAMLTIAGIVLTPSIVIRAAGGSDTYLSWAAFAAVAVCGVTTIVQAVRLGRIGAGYVLLMGTSGAFIAVCIGAMAQGGPALLATLVVISSFFQFALAARLSLVRRIFTPSVAGTVIMLIAVTVMPIIFDMLDKAPEGAPALAAPVSAGVTIAVIVAIALAATGVWRLWAPVIGVAVGSAVGGAFGIYDVARVAEAAWIGFPEGGWPGFDLDFGPAFWTLLPAFALVTLVGAIETVGDSIAIQHVSWRERRAVDYRAVEGAVAADGIGNLLSGLFGTIPNTTYSTSISVTELTGVAARRDRRRRRPDLPCAGPAAEGAWRPCWPFPAPVVAAYATVLLAMLFVVGMRIVVQDGIDYRKGHRRGRLLLGRRRLPARRDLPGSIFADFAGGLLAERHDGRRRGRHFPDDMPGSGQAPPKTHGNRVRRLRLPARQRVPPAIRIAQRLVRRTRRSGWTPSAKRRWRPSCSGTARGEARPPRRLRVSASREDGGRHAGVHHRLRRRQTISRTASPCWASTPPARRRSMRSRSGCCATSHPRCATSSITTRTS